MRDQVVVADVDVSQERDAGTLDRDRDVLVSTGLLVLPEPVVVVNRTGALSDARTFWQFITQHQILPSTRVCG